MLTAQIDSPRTCPAWCRDHAADLERRQVVADQTAACSPRTDCTSSRCWTPTGCTPPRSGALRCARASTRSPPSCASWWSSSRTSSRVVAAFCVGPWGDHSVGVDVTPALPAVLLTLRHRHDHRNSLGRLAATSCVSHARGCPVRLTQGQPQAELPGGLRPRDGRITLHREEPAVARSLAWPRRACGRPGRRGCVQRPQRGVRPPARAADRRCPRRWFRSSGVVDSRSSQGPSGLRATPGPTVLGSCTPRSHHSGRGCPEFAARGRMSQRLPATTDHLSDRPGCSRHQASGCPLGCPIEGAGGSAVGRGAKGRSPPGVRRGASPSN